MSDERLEFEDVYKSFRPKIHRYITRLVGRFEAEDLTQEVFVRIDKGLESFRGESQLSTWIYRIATNIALDRLRSPSFLKMIQKRPLDNLDEEDEEPNIAFKEERPPSPEQQAIRKEMHDCIQGFVQDLPENYRAVLILSEMEELSNNEIAEILGVSVALVKIRLHRARTRLFRELKAHCKAEDWL